MEKIEFYQRSAAIYRKYFIDIFSNFINESSKIIKENIENIITFFQILAMNVIKYFDLVVCFEKIINF